MRTKCGVFCRPIFPHAGAFGVRFWVLKSGDRKQGVIRKSVPQKRMRHAAAWAAGFPAPPVRRQPRQKRGWRLSFCLPGLTPLVQQACRHFVQNFSHLDRQPARRERFLEEGELGLQDAVPDHRIVGVA